ncbi:MAG TPA: tetratricopeptide repeat protein [Kofleriaceae bacterium]|jgi:tetratricopeptide (TPR) repeat protein
MPCPDANELARYALGTLDGARADVVRAHIDECATCRAASSALVSVSLEEPREDGAWTRPQLSAGGALGRFVISHELGEGAASVVYAAYDPQLDRNVALKLLRSRGAGLDDKLLREGRALAKISHPNVVNIFEVGDADQQLYIALELVEGVTARNWARLDKRSWRDVRGVIVQVGQGLGALHRAGLVHRDVKPDNIVVDADRARLVDFGLVGAGAGAGTPAYMAPEEDKDALSDQYSLAATFVDLVRAARSSRVVSADASRLSVPRRVRTALARALSPEPRDRFPSTAAFVAALADPPRWPLFVGISGLAVAGGVLAFLHAAPTAPGPCADVPAAWTPIDRSGVEAAFAADARPFVGDMRTRVLGRLDGFASAWKTERTGVCRAYHEKHELSDQGFDLRVACLERQQRAFAATVETIRSGPMDKAIEIAATLPTQDACRDADTLARVEPLPADPLARGAIAAVESDLARAKLAQKAGDAKAARAIAQSALAAARRTAYRPVIAEGAYRLADILERAGDVPGATPLVDEAIRVSAEARLDTIEAESWILSIVLRGLDGDAKDDELVAASRASEAASVRARDTMVTAALANVQGLVAKNRGDYAGAAEHYKHSIEILRASDDANPQIAASLGNLSNVLPQLGDMTGARAAADEAAKRDLEMFGAHHPQYADSLLALGMRENQMGEFAAAIEHQQDALAIIDASLGDDGPAAMTAHDNLASSLAQNHQLDEAKIQGQRALDLAIELRGPKHPITAQAMFSVANIAGEAEDWPRAEEYAQKALAIVMDTYGPDHPLAASILSNLGEWAGRRGDFKAAEAYLRQGMKGLSATPDSPYMAVVQTALAATLDAQHRDTEAIPLLEAALALRNKIGDDPVAIGDTQGTLARALWATGKKPRALELANAADKTFAEAGESASRYAEELHAWRTANHVPAPPLASGSAARSVDAAPPQP